MLNNNEIFGKNAAKTLFIQKKLLLAIDIDFYFGPKPENGLIVKEIENKNKVAKNGKLIFYMDQFKGIQKLYIFFKVATKVIAIAHRDRYLNFAKY